MEVDTEEAITEIVVMVVGVVAEIVSIVDCIFKSKINKFLF